jgi:CheY-like chemotaxis protein
MLFVRENLPKEMRMNENQESPVILRILIVEDTPERQEWLKGLYRDHAWVMVHTAARAIRLVHAYDFDFISLDYNLAGPENGDTVAKAIAISRNAHTPILVHSMNPQGANRLTQLLPHASCIPIGTIGKTNAIVKRVRESLHHGVPTNWLTLISGNTSTSDER